jgi:hypothetical protein
VGGVLEDHVPQAGGGLGHARFSLAVSAGDLLESMLVEVTIDGKSASNPPPPHNFEENGRGVEEGRQSPKAFSR